MAQPTRVHALTHRLAALTLVALLATMLIPASPMRAAPMAQDTPAEQCAKGIELLQAGKVAEALPLLEAGVAGRKGATFANPDDPGHCATFLVIAYQQSDQVASSLDAYAIALEVYEQTNNTQSIFRTLSGMANTAHGLQRYSDSLRYAQGALDIALEQNNQTWQGEALSIFGRNAWSAGNFEAALDYFLRAQTAFRADDNNAGLVGVAMHISDIYLRQGQRSKAEGTLAEAEIIANETNDTQSLFLIRNTLGTLYELQGQFDRALEEFQQALDLIPQLQPLFVAMAERITLMGRARTLTKAGYKQAALDDYMRIRELSRDDLALEHSALISIGQQYTALGQLGRAIEVFQQSLDLARERNAPIEAGISLQSMATTYFLQGRYDDAQAQLEEALQLFTSAPDLDFANQGRIVGMLNGLGLTYYEQGLYNEAIGYFEQALAKAEAIGDPGLAANVLIGRGRVLSAQGRHDEALRDLQESLKAANRSGSQLAISSANRHIGDELLVTGQLDEALEQYQAALEAQRISGSREGEIILFSRIADIYRLQSRSAEALAGYEQAIEALETQRAQAGDEQGRASFVGEYASVFEHAALLYHQQGDDTQAFLTAERGRARAFLDSLATGTVELSNETGKVLYGQEREAYAARQAAQDALIRARTLAEPDQALIADLEAQLQRAEAAYAEITAQIASRGDQLATLALARQDAVLSLEQVQASLGENTTLVSYLVGDEGDSLAFVVTREAFRVVELAVARDALTTQMAALHTFDGTSDQLTERLKTFYIQLIPSLQLDSSTRHLLIIPHGVLHYLPFAALTSDGQRFLGDEYTISLLPAASVLPYIQKSVTAGATLPSVVAMANAEGPPPVEGVEKAARYVGQLFGAEPLLSAEATVTNLQAADEGARVLHIGAHGSFNPAAPLESYLQLTPAGASDDGELTVGEVYGLNLKQAELVVLSACETQVNQLANPNSPLAVTAGDELVGMQRAFFFAGAQNVITTLWKVPDAPSQLMMERFYTYIRHGLAPADALQKAQQEVRAQYPNPRDWAGFVLSGVGATPLVEPPPWWRQVPWWAWALGGIGLLAAVGGGALLWRRHTRLPPGEKLAKD